MIKEKYIPHLATGIMLLVVIFVAVGVVFNVKNSGVSTEIEQPEYMEKIFNQDEILQINIQIDESNWENLKENASKEEYYPADITVNGETYYNVGIRAKGNSSLSMVASNDESDRYSFKIKVNNYQEQNIYGLDKFVLNNMIGDATYMKEYLSYDMFKELGIATPGFAFANITLNGEPWGVYLAVESLEESFVQRNYGDLDGNLYKVETSSGMGGGDKGGPGNEQGNMQGGPGNEQGNMQGGPGSEQGNMQGGSENAPVDDKAAGKENIPVDMSDTTENVPSEKSESGERGGPGGMGKSGGNLVYSDDNVDSYTDIFNYTILKTTTTQDYKTMISILKNLNEGTNLEDNIDIEEVLKYFAINTFLVNLDSYAGNMKHNFYLYEEDGKLQIIPWDFNLAFGAFEMKDASKVINFPIDTPVTDTMDNSPLISKLLEVDEYKEMYHSYLEELIEKYISSNKYSDTIDMLDKLIGEYVKEDATAFYSYDEYQVAIKELKQYGTDRTTSILAQISGTQPSDDYGTIETNINLMAMGQQNGGGPGGEGGPNGEDDHKMPDMQNMQKIQEIIGQVSSIDELTEEQKAQLQELGMNDEEIEKMLSMAKGFKQKPGMPGEKQEVIISKEDKIALGASIVALVLGIIFVLKFKRKRY